MLDNRLRSRLELRSAIVPESPAFETLQQWLTPDLQQHYLALLLQRVGVTGRRADCFVRLWLYSCLKDPQVRQALPEPPLKALPLPVRWIECSCREAAELFYSDRDRGGERSAGMMLDKLAALGLIEKQFDGNCTQIKIQPLPELAARESSPKPDEIALELDDFDLRCDAIPVASLLASNYDWLDRNAEAVPYRIANILREWASKYAVGMRILRRSDNQNPVGFYALYPVREASEVNFFSPPDRGLHLSRPSEVDPFEMALPESKACRSVFVRSFTIARSHYHNRVLGFFLKDVCQTLLRLRKDFPDLWDMYALIVHPNYGDLVRVLGFQKIGSDSRSSLYWTYQAVDRFLSLNIDEAIASLPAPETPE